MIVKLDLIKVFVSFVKHSTMREEKVKSKRSELKSCLPLFDWWSDFGLFELQLKWKGIARLLEDGWEEEVIILCFVSCAVVIVLNKRLAVCCIVYL